jgi:1-acyl-sn-glycerol-3-phosphate acyltransferase
VNTDFERPPSHRGLFRRLAGAYVRNKLHRELDGVWVRGLDAARALTDVGPVILAANHVSWWDSLLVVALDDALGTRGRALMDAQNLDRLPFFGWLGALPLDRASPQTVRADLHAAARTLKGGGDALWIFPQGRQRPAHMRPLDLKGGVHALAERSGAVVVPVALDYPWGRAPQPAAMVDFGDPLVATERDSFLRRLDQRLVAGLGRIDQASEQGPEDLGFMPLVPRRRRSPQFGAGARVLQISNRWMEDRNG